MKAYQPTNMKSCTQGFIGHAILLSSVPANQWAERGVVTQV